MPLVCASSVDRRGKGARQTSDHAFCLHCLVEYIWSGAAAVGLQFMWCVIVLLPMVAFWFSCCTLLVLRIVCFPLCFVSLCQVGQVVQELPQILHYFYFYMAMGHTHCCHHCYLHPEEVVGSHL